MNRLTLDIALSRRIELADARTAVGCAEMLLRRWPDSGVAFEKIAGGYAIFCGPNSPLTQAVAMALDGNATEEEFDRLESFYRQRGEPVRVETSPLAHPAFVQQFGRRGYRVTEFTNVMAQLLSSPGEGERNPVPVDGVAIEKICVEQADPWATLVSDGFATQPPSIPEIVETMKTFALSPDVECYLARVGGELAGGGALSLRDGVALLFGASTLRAFRGRGVQTALLQTRLARAIESGSELAVCMAQPGSTSQRNIARQGFQALYTRVKFERAWER